MHSMECDNKYNFTPTHILHTGARVKVDTKSGNNYAWATVDGDFQVAEQSRELEPHKESGMRLFLAMHAFTLFGFNYHPGTVGHYSAGTLLFASIKKGAGLTCIPKQKG